MPPSSAGRRPSSTWRSITARSRSGSIGGLVTWARPGGDDPSTGRSIRARAGVGVSSPMLQSGSLAVEDHRPDVEPGALGIQPGHVAQLRRGGRTRPGRRVPDDRSVGERRRGRVAAARTGGGSRSSPRRPRGSPPGAGRRASISPGPSRPSRAVSADAIGTAPASEAAATSRSRVTAKASGRSPFRSTMAPTRRPSPKTSAAGSVPRREEAGRPARERAGQRVAGRPQRRRFGDQRQQRRLEAPAGRDEQLERLVERQRVGARRRQERAGRDEALAGRPSDPERIGRPAARPARGSPRTVLISPLWAIAPERLGQPPGRDGYSSRSAGGRPRG